MADENQKTGEAQSPSVKVPEEKLQVWEKLGHKFEAGELDKLKESIADMALSRIDGQEELYVGG